MAVLHPQLKTKKHAKLILRAHEFSANDAAIEALLDTHTTISTLRKCVFQPIVDGISG